jgi:hypothetical protein
MKSLFIPISKLTSSSNAHFKQNYTFHSTDFSSKKKDPADFKNNNMTFMDI